MDIKAINAQLMQAVTALQSPTAVTGAGAARAAHGGDFIASLDSALQAVSKSQDSANELQRQFQLENPQVSLEETMIAINKSQISFQGAVQVRNKLVQAYEQVMSMPV